MEELAYNKRAMKMGKVIKSIMTSYKRGSTKEVFG